MNLEVYKLNLEVYKCFMNPLIERSDWSETLKYGITLDYSILYTISEIYLYYNYLCMCALSVDISHAAESSVTQHILIIITNVEVGFSIVHVSEL